MIRLFASTLAIALVLSACQTTRKGTTEPGKTTPQPTPGSGSDKTPLPPKPALKSVNLPKVGLILGPGGFKTFAHLGVIRELEKAGFKIHSIVGLEWGALVGGIYAQRGRANDLEWQLSKLKKNDLPQDANYGSNYNPAPIKGMSKYLETVFQQSKFEGGSIGFACPGLLLRNGKTAWWDQGLIRPGVEKCMSFPPIFTATNGWVAAAFDISESAKKLREMGAEVIVLVNVLARGNILKENRVRAQDEAEVIWWNGANVINAQQNGLDWVVGIHTRNYDILDFEARQSFVMFGQEFGAAAAKKMAEHYGL